ncbi:MAG TPA: HAMP domain-containing sensor histidine kinase [Bacilli bacterium]|nr:HAMP domain-containing sensor histidine kinase [Bacilli bacterium]
MIKSLYVRLVLTFLAVVTIAMIASAYITSQLYRTPIAESVQKQTVQLGRDVALLYQKMPPDEFDAYFRENIAVKAFQFAIYRDDGSVKTYGPDADMIPKTISTDLQQKVLQGGVQRTDIPHLEHRNPDALLVGIPFQQGGHRYALFVRPYFAAQAEQINEALTIVPLIALAIGSLLILIASRYLVRPLKAMTQATRRLARGDFDVRIPFKRRDELGELATSFNSMAQELKQLEQMRQEFVSNVSHEIQSPLTSIRGFSIALRDKSLPEAERERYLDIIRTESERLSRLSENLLRLAALEADHHPYHPREYALDEQLRQTIITAEPQWAAKRLDIDLDLPPTVITADQDLLGQVWINLLTNAIRYTPEGGRIIVAIATSDTDTHVTLQDTGVGIPPDEQPRIFQRFYKVDKSRHRDQSGSGLGLSIAKKIIDLHQGEITLHSEPNQGTTFQIKLPSPF